MSETTQGTCDSCGEVAEVRGVRRVWVTPEAWDTEGSVTVAEDTERWCPVCLLHYPHQDLDA